MIREAIRGAIVAGVLSLGLAGPAAAQQAKASHAGAAVYKSAQCIVCHKWHGMGGPGYGGTPINFRETILNREQVIEVISCGRPGTGMPYHRKDAYDGYECYGGMTKEELGEDMPGRSRMTLSARQIKHVAGFIIDHFKGRSNELVKSDCTIFFGKSKMCTHLKSVAATATGGGGH